MTLLNWETYFYTKLKYEGTFKWERHKNHRIYICFQLFVVHSNAFWNILCGPYFQASKDKEILIISFASHFTSYIFLIEYKKMYWLH